MSDNECEVMMTQINDVIVIFGLSHSILTLVSLENVDNKVIAVYIPSRVICTVVQTFEKIRSLSLSI